MMIRDSRHLIICLLMGSLAGCVAVSEQRPMVERLVDGSPLHGIQGLAWGEDGYLYAAAVSAQKVSRIDPKTGAVETLIEAPAGESDDVASGPDGTLVWTAMFAGELRAQRPGGPIEVLGADIRGVNPVAFSPDGRLFAATIGQVSRLWEFDLGAKEPPRLITDKVDGLNSFDFTPDGHILGPYWRSGKLVKIDVETGEITILAEGLGRPAAMELDSRGQVISVDYYSGDVRRTDPETGISTIIARLDPPLDNLAVGPDDTIYVSDSARSGILALAPDGTFERHITGGEFSMVGGLDIISVGGRTVLVAADSMGYRFVDTDDGFVIRPRFNGEFGGSTDIAVSDRLFALTDARNGRVHVMDRATGELLYRRSDFTNPYGVVILANQDILTVDYGTGALLRWNRQDNATVMEGLRGPVGLALETESTVLVTEYDSGTLIRVDLKTGGKTELLAGLDKPEGLALMADDRIAVAETGAGRVVAVDPDQSRLDVLADGLEFGVAALFTPGDVGRPAGVAVGPDGTIYVSEDRRNGITKISLKDRR